MVGVGRIVGLIAPAHEHGVNLMESAKHRMVVKLPAEEHILIIGRLADKFVGRIGVVAILVETDYHILAVEIAPHGLIDGITFAETLGIHRTVVDSKGCLERETFEYGLEVKVQTHVKEKCTGLGLHISGLEGVADGIG